jgi:3-hydroxyacyl-CoA dehydrogenase/enoyl-CoA hydratase/3-hydroxybutyryl-CoA epimerase
MNTMGPSEVSGFDLSRTDDGIVVALLNLPGKVNIMDDSFIAAMAALLDRLEARRDYSGVVFSSAKPLFLAGGDLKRMSEAAPGQEQELFDYFEDLKSYLRRLEKLNRPVVAAINGTAVGGGYETCLACHHRIALRDPKIRVGLPEVEFGILAGAGGVVRLTRLVGFARAVPYLVRGTLVDTVSALREGLVDDLADDMPSLIEKSCAWIRANPQARQPWDGPDNAVPQHSLSLSQRQALRAEPARLYASALRDSQAAARNLSLAAESLSMDFDAALRLETRAVVELLLTDAAQGAIQAFFERKAAPMKRADARASA